MVRVLFSAYWKLVTRALQSFSDRMKKQSLDGLRESAGILLCQSGFLKGGQKATIASLGKWSSWLMGKHGWLVLKGKLKETKAF